MLLAPSRCRKFWEFWFSSSVFPICCRNFALFFQKIIFEFLFFAKSKFSKNSKLRILRGRYPGVLAGFSSPNIIRPTFSALHPSLKFSNFKFTIFKKFNKLLQNQIQNYKSFGRPPPCTRNQNWNSATLSSHRNCLHTRKNTFGFL